MTKWAKSVSLVAALALAGCEGTMGDIGSSACGTNGVAVSTPPYVSSDSRGGADYHLAGAPGSTAADGFVRATGGD